VAGSASFSLGVTPSHRQEWPAQASFALPRVDSVPRLHPNEELDETNDLAGVSTPGSGLLLHAFGRSVHRRPELLGDLIADGLGDVPPVDNSAAEQGNITGLCQVDAGKAGGLVLLDARCAGEQGRRSGLLPLCPPSTLRGFADSQAAIYHFRTFGTNANLQSAPRFCRLGDHPAVASGSSTGTIVPTAESQAAASGCFNSFSASVAAARSRRFDVGSESTS
jgi:hypothetical protein